MSILYDMLHGHIWTYGIFGFGQCTRLVGWVGFVIWWVGLGAEKMDLCLLYRAADVVVVFV